MGAGHPEAVDVADVLALDVVVDGPDVLVSLVFADLVSGCLDVWIWVWVRVCFGVEVCLGVLQGVVEAFNEVVGAPKTR